MILIVQLIRLIWQLLWFALTHPGADAVAALVVVTWLGMGWPGVVGLAAISVVGLAGLRILQLRGSPGSRRCRCGTGCGGASTGAGGKPR